VAGGQILAFPIDFDRRPYNTLALPCECVSRSGDMIVGVEIENGSCDPDLAPLGVVCQFIIDHITLTTCLYGSFVICSYHFILPICVQNLAASASSIPEIMIGGPIIIMVHVT